MSSQFQFFAFGKDLLAVLAEVEIREELNYILAGRSLVPEFIRYQTFADIPDLGVAHRESATTCKSYLIVEAGSPVKVRRVHESDGIDSYHTDQLVNQESIVFAPGGLWKRKTLLYGRFGTASESAISKRLMRVFRSAIRKHFKKIDGWYLVGPEALKFLREGNRLTIAAQSPPEFDLVLR